MKHIKPFESFLTENEETQLELNESKLKFRNKNTTDTETNGVIDTALLDQLIKQIAPHIGYADWEARSKRNTDHKELIQIIAKELTGDSLSDNRLIFV